MWLFVSLFKMLHALAVINRIVAMIVTSVFSFMIADDDNTIYCKEGIFVCRFGCKSKTGVKSQTFSKCVARIPGGTKRNG